MSQLNEHDAHCEAKVYGICLCRERVLEMELAACKAVLRNWVNDPADLKRSTIVTPSDFEAALIHAYKKAARMFGTDFASSAIISTIKKGPDAFVNQESVQNYVLSSAKGDRKQARMRIQIRTKKNEELSRERSDECVPPVDEDTYMLDVTSATQGLETDLKDAVEAYMLYGESLTTASQLIDAKVSKMTKYYWLKTEIKRIMETKRMQDYKKIIAITGFLLGLFTQTVEASCSTQTYILGPKVIICTTCCYGQHCTTTCN